MTKRLAAALFVGSLGLATVAGAQSGFERPPVLKAGDLAPAAMLAGPRFAVDERVPVRDLLPHFAIRSDFGVFEAHGTDMLGTRVAEIGALDHLEKTSKSEEFLRAAGGAVARPVKSAANMVVNPVDTITGMPAAAGRFFDRVGRGVKGVSKATESADTAGDKAAIITNRVGGLTADVFGYEQERRALAKRVGADPYTTNPVLAEKLDSVAWAAFAGRVSVNAAVSVAVPFSMAISATSITNDLVWDMKPADLLALNEKKLKATGAGEEQVAALIGNKWYSITMLTSLVDGLERLEGVKGRDQVVAFAATAASEDAARLTMRAVEMFARYHATQPLTQLAAPGPIVARTKAGVTLVAAPLDYVSWSERVATFARRSDLTARNRTLWVTGTFSPHARRELQTAGWTLQEGAAQSAARLQ